MTPIRRARLVRVRILKNNGMALEYAHASGAKSIRFEPPNGSVTLSEAAKALGTNSMWLRRRKDSGALKPVNRTGPVRIAVSEVLRLRKEA